MEIESYNVYVENHLDAEDLSLDEAMAHVRFVFQKYRDDVGTMDVRIVKIWRPYKPKEAEWLWEEDN